MRLQPAAPKPPPMRMLIAILATLAAALLAAPAAAQEPAAIDRPTLEAHRSPTAPDLDGIVLGDAAWAGVPAATGFIQTRPTLAAPASERTEVRVLFTDTAIYFGVICFDTEPEGVIISDTRRDASLRDTDSFQIILDTFGDRRNGFVFGTNAAGIEYDGQVQNEGRGGFGGGRQQRGSGGGFNLNWDAAWQVEAIVGDFGWSAEFAIPWSTLRYPVSEVQTWGINFQRNIRRKIETAFWSPLDRQYNLYRLSDAGSLAAIEPPPQRLLHLIPYALAQGARDATGSSTDNFELGIDLKYGVTRSLTLDATYNTDFAQVEVDEQQINLDRFSLFFPEKRPFFLENAGLFTVGLSGLAELFFSRRIGLEDGSVVPILGGARLTGKLGDTQVGVLTMQTDSQAALHGDHFSVARVRHELPNRTHFGALVTDRRGVGSTAAAGSEYQTFALDGQVGFGEHRQLSGFLSKTSTPGIRHDDHAFQVRLDSSTEKLRWFVDYAEVGAGFNPEMGFLSRTAFRRPSGLFFYTFRPTDFGGLYEIRPHVSYTGFWDFSGFQESGRWHIDNHWEWRSGVELHTGVNLTHEGLMEPFEIRDDLQIPSGIYENEEVQVVFRTDRGRPLSVSLRATVGGFFSGDRTALSPSIDFRRGERFTSRLSWGHNDIRLAEGDFVTNLGQLRLTYSFTNEVLIQGLFQYNDSSDDFSTNLRFTWLQTANTGLFVVYNEMREIGMTALPKSDRSLIVKYSRLIDVFRRR